MKDDFEIFMSHDLFSIDCMSITEPDTTTTSFDADRKMEGELFKYKDMSLCVYLFIIYVFCNKSQ